MQRLLYILIYPILWITSLLPMQLLYIKSSFLYVFAFYIIGYRRRVVKNNIKLVFPDKSKAEQKVIAKRYYQHLCDLIFETIKSISISESEIKRRFNVTNLDILAPYYQNNRSILLMAGHYGNWEWSGILNVIMEHQGAAVYKPLDSIHFDKMVKKIRERFGGVIVSNRKIVPFLFRSKTRGMKTVTYILSDQTPKASAFKHKDSFMGIDVPVFTGTEELAKKLDFAVMYLKVEKVKRGYYDVSFVKLADNPTEHEDYQITRLFLDQIEKQIREKPHFYLWSHKRWKHRNVPLPQNSNQ